MSRPVALITGGGRGIGFGCATSLAAAGFDIAINGLREETNFERRYRDFQAMPLHIISHIDRMTEQSGRNALGLDTQNPF